MRHGDRIFQWTMTGFGLAVAGLFVFIVGLLLRDAWPAIVHFGPGFLVSDAWNVPDQDLGGWAFLYGTIVTSAIALALAVPVGIGTAIALALILPKRVANVVGTVVELLAGVPSIVFGVWGLAIVVPYIKKIGPADTFGPSLLSAGAVLAVMVLPMITAVSRDVLAAVPRHQSEAARALGATDWEVAWQVVVPHARAGLTASVILALGRAVGETMAVIMVVGNVAQVTPDIFQSAATLASVIANEFGDPSGPLHTAALVELGLILLGLSLVVNILARRVTKKLNQRAIA